jgi:hypothetical protein
VQLATRPGDHKAPRLSLAGIFSTASFQRLKYLYQSPSKARTLAGWIGDAADWAINFSLWGLALLIFSGTILAFLVW